MVCGEGIVNPFPKTDAFHYDLIANDSGSHSLNSEMLSFEPYKKVTDRDIISLRFKHEKGTLLRPNLRDLIKTIALVERAVSMVCTIAKLKLWLIVLLTMFKLCGRSRRVSPAEIELIVADLDDSMSTISISDNAEVLIHCVSFPPPGGNRFNILFSVLTKGRELLKFCHLQNIKLVRILISSGVDMEHCEKVCTVSF